MESTEQNPPNGRSGQDAGSTTLGDRVDRVSQTAEQAWARTRDAFGDIKETVDLQGRANRHPYGTVAAALGIGYVLGGGLFSPLTGRLVGLGLRIGLRLAVLPMLKEELFGLAEALEGEEVGGHEAGRGRRKSAKRTT
jgi:hypothetical protein